MRTETSQALNSEQELASIPTAQGGLSRIAIARLKRADVPVVDKVAGWEGIKETRPKFNNGNAARSLHIWLAGCGTIARAFRGRRAPADPPAGARPTLVSF